jgi:hypothetical protein
MTNGFYWIICNDIDSKQQVAEYVDGEWFLCGFSQAFKPEQVEVIREVTSMVAG